MPGSQHLQGAQGRLLRAVQHGMNLEGLSGKELLDITRAMYFSRIVDHDFTQKIMDQLRPIIHTCSPREIATFAQIFLKRQELDTQLFSRMIDALLPKIRETSTKDLSLVLLSFAQLEFTDQRLSYAFCKEFVRRTALGEKIDTSDLTYVASALGKLKFFSQDAIRCWVKHMMKADRDTLTPFNVAMVAHSTDVMGVFAPSLFRRLKEVQYENPPELSADLSRSTFLTYSFMGFTDPRFLHFIISRANFREIAKKEFQRYNLALAANVLEDEKFAIGEIPFKTLKDILEMYRRLEERREESTSGLQTEVLTALHGLYKKKDVTLEGAAGPFLIDLVL